MKLPAEIFGDHGFVQHRTKGSFQRPVTLSHQTQQHYEFLVGTDANFRFFFTGWGGFQFDWAAASPARRLTIFAISRNFLTSVSLVLIRNIRRWRNTDAARGVTMMVFRTVSSSLSHFINLEIMEMTRLPGRRCFLGRVFIFIAGTLPQPHWLAGCCNPPESSGSRCAHWSDNTRDG